MIVVLWRTGLGISEALTLAEADLDRQRGAVLVRAGEAGGRNGSLGVGAARSLARARTGLPAGALFCVLRGPTRDRPCAPAGIRGQLRSAARPPGCVAG